MEFDDEEVVGEIHTTQNDCNLRSKGVALTSTTPSSSIMNSKKKTAGKSTTAFQYLTIE